LPRTSLRAACAVLALLGVSFVAPVTGSVEEHWPDRPALVVLQPSLHAWSIADCGYTSPLKNECETYPNSCPSVCYPAALGGFGYTGRVTAYLYGKSSAQAGARDVYVAQSCAYLASSQTQVGPVDAGGCSYFATADRVCYNGDCSYYALWPPFKLRGDSGKTGNGLGPAGSWTVRLLAT